MSSGDQTTMNGGVEEEEDKSQLGVLVQKVISTSLVSNTGLPDGSIEESFMARNNLSSFLFKNLRTFHLTDVPVEEDDLILLESFFGKYLLQMISCTLKVSDGVISSGQGQESVWKWVKSLISELHETVSSSLYLLNKCKVHLLISLLKTYHTLIDSSFERLSSTGPSKVLIMDLMMVHDYVYEAMITMKDLLILLLSYSSLPHEIQLFFDLVNDPFHAKYSSPAAINSSSATSSHATKSLSLPSSPKHTSKDSKDNNISPSSPSSPAKNGSSTSNNLPKNSPRHGSLLNSSSMTDGAPCPGRAINANEIEVNSSAGASAHETKIAISDQGKSVKGIEEEETESEDLYYSMLPSSLNHTLTSSLPTSMFAFTPCSSLSLPPIKTFPLKNFTFSSNIRLENIVTQSRNQMNGPDNVFGNQTQYPGGFAGGQFGRGNRERSSSSSSGDVQRMFLFSFKTSTTPPLAYTAYFSFPNNAVSQKSEKVCEDSVINYLKLTVSCFKGSSSPSLSHTLSFPFPLSSPSTGSASSSITTAGFMHLSLTFSSTALSLFINGELIESNNNDWSISSVKAPGPIFDRCFIGCPSSSQVMGGHGSSAGQRSVNNSNDTGFTGQLTSIYIFNCALSPNSVHFLHLIDPSNERPVISSIRSFSGHQGSNCHRQESVQSLYMKSQSNLSVNRKEKEKAIKELHSSLVCLYSPMNINWPIALQLITTNQLTSHALIQGNLEVIQRSLITDSIQSLNQGFEVILSLLNQFLKNNMYNEYSQLVAFSTSLIGTSGLIGTNREDLQMYFIESAINCNFFHQLLSGLNSLPDWKKINFLSFPSQLISSIIFLVQSLLIIDHGKSTPVTITFDPTALEKKENFEERANKLKAEIIRQVMDLFIFNSFLWTLLVPQVSDHRPAEHYLVSPKKQKQREEAISTLYNFVSTNLLSGQDLKFDQSNFAESGYSTNINILLRRNKRVSFMLQIFTSLRIHYYHRKPQSDRSIQSDIGDGIQENDRVAHEEFNRRERIIAGIRSNCLMFIKSLLSKSSSRSSLVTPSLTADLIDENNESSNKRNSSSGGEEMDQNHDEEDNLFDEETNSILNYLSITSREVFLKGNPDQKSLLNIIDVLSLLNSLLVELPATMIPSFDTRKGIQVLFQLINDSILSRLIDQENNQEKDEEKEEREVIRSFCLKIIGSFLMRSTLKRKSQAMTSAHFSMLHYMLSQDPSIVTHQLYVNLMEITIESPISSIYSLQATLKNRKSGKDQSAPSQPGNQNNSSHEVVDSDPFNQIELDLLDWSTGNLNRSGDGKDDGQKSSLKEPSVKIENPQMIKVIALLVVNNKRLGDEFLKDLHTLLLDSRANRRLILQMSVWQSWLISFLKMDYLDNHANRQSDHDSNEKERKKREQTVINLFKLLLYHALRWEFGGWRVWIDSLAIIHSFLSKEAFNKMYNSYATGQNSQRGHPKQRSSDAKDFNDTELSGPEKPPRVTPTYRIPSFRWSSIHVQLLDLLVGAVINDINSFRKEALLRANLAGGGERNVVTGDFPELNPDSESFILESLLLSSDIYVINIIHLISQLCDSTILDAGGLLPLLAAATSSSASKGNASPTPGSSNEDHDKKSSDSSVDMMTDSRATELLHQLTFLADYLIFNSFTSLSGVPLAPSGSVLGTSNGVSLAELEAEKNMSSGGLLRQILRLVSMVAVKRVLRLKDKSCPDGQSTTGLAAIPNPALSVPIIAVKDLELSDTSAKDEDETSSDEESVDDDDEEDSDPADKIRKPIRTLNPVLNTVSGGVNQGSGNTFNDKCYLPMDEEEEHLLLCVKDIERLRATLYRTDPASSSDGNNGGKDRTNSNFLALSALYFLSVLLVSKYRDSLESSSSSKTSTAPTQVSQTPGQQSKQEPDLMVQLENSLYPTIQLLKEIISDFEIFLSKSLLGSKGQVLLTKSLVKRVKSNECSSLELVMLLCSQEFQNSLQKNAGLAFIELINEGRLLSISMKEHIIRVGIEADFILARIESEDKERELRFKKESVTIEGMREKEVDLICSVITELNCLSLSGEVHGAAKINNAASGKKRRGSTSCYSYRDLDEFIREKKLILSKEQEYMVQQEIKQQQQHQLKHHQEKLATQTALIESVKSSNAAKAGSQDGPSSTELYQLRDQIKLLQSKVATVEKERDEALTQLKMEKERSSTQSTPDTSLVLETASQRLASEEQRESVFRTQSESSELENSIPSLATTGLSMSAVSVPSIITSEYVPASDNEPSIPSTNNNEED